MKKSTIIISMATLLVAATLTSGVKGNTTAPVTETETESTITVHFNGTDKEIPNYESFEAEYKASLAEKGIENYIIYDCSELTSEMLESRTSDTLIIERVIGIVTNANEEGDGQVLNIAPNTGWYIKYDKGIEEGTVMLSYFIYNTETQYVDDITERADYVLCVEYVD